jgi:hypothetical protein
LDTLITLVPARSETQTQPRPVSKMALSLDALDTGKVRKTEDGLFLSVYDVIRVVKGCSAIVASNTYLRLLKEERVPAFPATCLIHQTGESIRGGCRKPTPVADARGIVQLVWALPGKSDFRRQCADVCVRYLGGDTTLVDEIFKNRAAQEVLAREDPEHPARVFGEAVESEAIKRKREELVHSELDVQIMRALADRAEEETRYKRARVSAILELHASANLELDDRARLQLRDLVGSVTAAEPQIKEICIREFLLAKKIRIGRQCEFGKVVAKLKRAELLKANPNEEPVLLKKRIEVNGQVRYANLYLEDDLHLFEEAYSSKRWV